MTGRKKPHKQDGMALIHPHAAAIDIGSRMHVAAVAPDRNAMPVRTFGHQEHHHAGIGLMTPDQVHYGQADAIHTARQNTLDGAFNRNPERFVRKEPEPPAKPTATWINPPQKKLNIEA